MYEVDEHGAEAALQNVGAEPEDHFAIVPTRLHDGAHDRAEVLAEQDARQPREEVCGRLALHGRPGELRLRHLVRPDLQRDGADAGEIDRIVHGALPGVVAEPG